MTKTTRARYTLEFKQEAVRQVEGEQSIAAVASFHGGNLATDASSSPDLLAPQLKAEVYVAGADKDGSYPPAMAERLEAAFAAASVHYVAAIYHGAAHD